MRPSSRFTAVVNVAEASPCPPAAQHASGSRSVKRAHRASDTWHPATAPGPRAPGREWKDSLRCTREGSGKELSRAEAVAPATE